MVGPTALVSHLPSSFLVVQRQFYNSRFTSLFCDLSLLLLYCAADSYCLRYLLLLLAGDVERNPGPIERDAKPEMYSLLNMTYTNENGEYVDFRLMDRIKPRMTDMAIALRLPQYTIDDLKQQSNPVRYLLSEWLEGRNSDQSDSRPRTWGTMIAALQHANLLEEARILEQQVKPVATVSQASSATIHTTNISDDRNQTTPERHSEGGCTFQNGTVKVSVRAGPDVPKDLIPLMKSYADLLVVFKKAKLRKAKFYDLKRFLSVFCDEKSIEKCDTTDQVISSLHENLKIYFFNIDALEVSCDRFHSSKAKRLLQKYKEQLQHFLANCSVKEFKGALKTEIRGSSEVETVTIKLEESIAMYTLEGLRKLIFHFFGVLYKVLIQCGIDEGCVRVTWVVSASLVPILREKAEKLSPEYLASKGVLEIVIGLRIAPKEGIVLRSEADTPKQHPIDVDDSSMMMATIQKRHQSELEEQRKEVERLVGVVTTSMDREEQLKRDLDMAKRSAQAEINQLKNELKEIKKKYSVEEKQSTDVPLKPKRVPIIVGDVKLEQVIDELKEVADDWKLFGKNLVSEHLLKEIELQEKTPVECLELVIVHWKELYPGGNWMDIVAALKKIKHSKLANFLQQKYAATETPSEPEDLMSQVCSEENLAQIAIWIIDWRRVSPFLGLTEADEKAILESEAISVPNQKVAMLRKWKQKQGPKATYKRLCRAFRNCGLDHLQEMVRMQLVFGNRDLPDIEATASTPGASAATAKPATTEKIWQLRESTDAEYILSGRPNGTYLVWEKSGSPPIDSSSLSVNTHYISVVVQGKVDYVSVYKKGHYYGFLHHEEYHSVEDLILQLTVYGFTIARTTQVRLIHRLLPDKDVLAKLPKDILQPTIALITASDVATVSQDYPHHDERTWFRSDFTKKKSEKVLKGKQDETFLV